MTKFSTAMSGNSYAPFALREFLAEVKGYDVIIIDPPGDFNLQTQNAIQASDLLISPVQPEQYNAENIPLLLKELKNERATLDGMFITFKRKLNAHDAVIDAIKSKYGDLLMETMIPSDTKIKEAAIAGELLTKYSPKSKAALAYGNLKNEIWEQQK
jgi:chromosome partitioning protein